VNRESGANEGENFMSGNLYRSKTDKFLGGVCGGLGRYLGFDAAIVRLIFLLLIFGTGWGVVLYIALWILLPAEGSPEPGGGDVGDQLAVRMKGVGEDIRQATQQPNPKAGLWFGAGLILLGAFLLLQRLGETLGIAWLNTFFGWQLVLPALIIIIGVAIIIRGMRKGE
jgi:phage shock protein PspC (stress-responsive transcriptional regulator)